MYTTTTFLVGGGESIASIVRSAALKTAGCQFRHLASLREAKARICAEPVSLVLVYLPSTKHEPAVCELLEDLRRRQSSTSVVVLSEYYDAELSIRLLQLGAVDCLVPPFNTSRLAMLVDMLTVRARHGIGTERGLASEPAAEKSKPDSAAEDLLGYLVVSEAGRRLMGEIRRAAPLDSHILLTGETGTGKTHLARLIHRVSPRHRDPFLVINCGALSPTLIESEMFGHVRGAFTGADSDHVGKLEQVKNGTLLLDEIDSLPLSSQSKLLRAVEDRVFERVGSNRSLPLKARLVAAANRPLQQEVAEGRFRSDLYYRLNVLDFHVPPLRERRELITPLAGRLLEEFSTKNRRPVGRFTDQALMALTAHDWPGNVRELRNVVERSAALSTETTIDVSDLPAAIRNGAVSELERREIGRQGNLATRGNQLAEARSVAEKQRLADALNRNKNNRCRAAIELGISRVTLYKKLHKYGLV